MHVHIFKYLFVACREDYTRLFEFVSEKNLRVKNTGKAPVQTVSYNDDASSESGHDAYLERMKAEGEERDSDDGVCACVYFVTAIIIHCIVIPSHLFRGLGLCCWSQWQ